MSKVDHNKENNVRAYRTSKRMTMKKLAYLAGYSVGYISLIESGEYGAAEKAVIKISEALEEPVGNLFPFHKLSNEYIDKRFMKVGDSLVTIEEYKLKDQTLIEEFNATYRPWMLSKEGAA